MLLERIASRETAHVCHADCRRAEAVVQDGKGRHDSGALAALGRLRGADIARSALDPALSTAGQCWARRRGGRRWSAAAVRAGRQLLLSCCVLTLQGSTQVTAPVCGSCMIGDHVGSCSRARAA